MLPSFPGVCVAVEAFHSPAIILCTPIARTQISFWSYSFIRVVYQLYVFKFMNASSQVFVVFMHFIHLLFWFYSFMQ